MTRRITPEQFQEYRLQWNQPVEDGDVEAQRQKTNAGYWVAYCFAEREGGADRDQAQAQQILEQAIQQEMTGTDDGTGKHRCLLANIIHYVNQERARRLFRQAVPRLEMEVQEGGNDKNYQEAAFWLGLNLFIGRGVDEDKPRGIHWLKIAAELGHTGAQFTIQCNCFQEPFFAEIVSWWQQLAYENNNAWAQQQLGECHQYGCGVEKDLVKAVEWYNKAIAQGYDRANNWRQNLLHQLNPEERSKTLGCVARNQKIEKAKSLIQPPEPVSVPLSLWSHALASFQHQENAPWEAPSPIFLSLKDVITSQLWERSKKSQKRDLQTGNEKPGTFKRFG